jgi:hypothetical protein
MHDVIGRLEALRRAASQREMEASPSRSRSLADIVQAQGRASCRVSSTGAPEGPGSDSGTGSDSEGDDYSRDPCRGSMKRLRVEASHVDLFEAGDYVKRLTDAKIRDARRAQIAKMEHLTLSRLEEMQSIAEDTLRKVSFVNGGAVITATPLKRTPAKKRK